MIEVKNVQKHYKVHIREAGFAASLKSLFARRFQIVKAVDGISFHIPKGQIVGFLGPNGAGKTTMMKMLTGLLHPTAGEIKVAGYRPADQKNEFKRKVSLVMGQKSQLLWDLPATESFLINKEIYEISDADYEVHLAKLTELLELENLLQKPVRQLSLGERMKCELVAALLHKPEILFLDEPTIGLDVNMQETMRRFIAEYNKEYGATILLTSHYMADVSALCKRVMVIGRGTLLYDGPIQQLIKRHAPNKRIELTFSERSEHASFIRQQNDDELEIVRSQYPTVVVEVPRDQVSAASSRLLGQYTLTDLTIEEPSMEQVISRAFAAEAEAEGSTVQSQLKSGDRE